GVMKHEIFVSLPSYWLVRWRTSNCRSYTRVAAMTASSVAETRLKAKAVIMKKVVKVAVIILAASLVACGGGGGGGSANTATGSNPHSAGIQVSGTAIAPANGQA